MFLLWDSFPLPDVKRNAHKEQSQETLTFGLGFNA